MSLIATIAIATLGQKSDQPAIELLGRVLVHYRNTTSAAGSVNLTVSDGRGSKDVVTDFGYEKPAKLWLTQRQAAPTAWAYAAKSDGKFLVYDPPVNRDLHLVRREPPPVLELVKTDEGELRTVPELYGGFRPLLPTGDNPPLDIIFSRKEHLEFLRTQWGSITSEGKGKVGSVDVTWIGGDFKPVGTYVSGHWRMAVTGTDDIVRYELKERFSDKPGSEVGAVTVFYTFDVAVKLEEKIAPEKFVVDRELVKKLVNEMKNQGKDITRFLGG